MATTSRLPGTLRRAVAAHRRLLAAGCAALAVASAVEALAPRPPHVVRVLAAARDLTAGATLTADDLTAVDLPAEVVPDGALLPGAAVLGRAVGGPVRRGEALTDARLLGPSLLAGAGGGRGVVAVPVRLADPDAVGLVRAGDRVDVLAAPLESVDGRPPPVSVVAAGVLVLAAPAASSGDDGSLIVVAVDGDTAKALARAATNARLSVALRGAP